MEDIFLYDSGIKSPLESKCYVNFKICEGLCGDSRDGCLKYFQGIEKNYPKEENE